MRQITLTAYKFNELSESAKEKVIEKHYENEDYYFLSDDLTESCKDYLKEYECNYKDIKLYYSLCNCQGDGVCFTGLIEKNGVTLELKHFGRYYHARSTNMLFYDENGEDIDDNKELSDIYFDICKRLENEGYNIIEYRMDNEEFGELSDANNYEYYENGELI